ncbi:GWxTD domain-containing protein, partial [Gemmatimonadota bacterium]
DKTEQALADFKHVLHSESDSFRISAYCGLAWCSFVPGKRRGDSMDYLRRALSVDKHSAEALYAKAMIILSGDVTTDDARMVKRALFQLLEMDLGYRDIYHLWRDVVLDRTDEEIRLVDELLAAYLDAHPDSASWRLDLAWDRYLVEDAGAALEELARLAADNPAFSHPDQLLLAARCHLETGDTLAFQNLYWKAVDLAGQSGQAGQFDRLLAEAAAIFTPDDAKQCREAIAGGLQQQFLHYFWANVDPIKLSPANNRLTAHYTRLAYAQRHYRQDQPHNWYNTKENTNRLLGFQGFYGEFHSEETTFSPGHNLALDHRGLLYLRYGPPDRIKNERLAENENVKYNPVGKRAYNRMNNLMESWWYGRIPFVFEKLPLTGEYTFRPLSTGDVTGYANRLGDDLSIDAATWGDMQTAMTEQRFVQPGIHESEDYYLAQFRTSDGTGIEAEIYQDEVLPGDASPTSAIAASYDTLWTERERNPGEFFRIPGERDNRWVAVHTLEMKPGKSNYSIEFTAGVDSWDGRGMLNLEPFSQSYLVLSAVVLGLDPPGVDSPAHERRGVRFIPRPSFRFQQGEKIRVYLEYYNLAVDSDDMRSYREYIDVIRYEGEWGSLGKITGKMVGLLTFGESKGQTEVNFNFDRDIEAVDGPVAESFLIDSSELLPGKYRLLIEARDNVNQFWDDEAVMFEIID